MTPLNPKIFDLPTLLEQPAFWRAEKTTVVWSNSRFDLVHVGHVRTLSAARRLGDVVVVGLNSDRSARAIKVTSRPIIPEQE